MKIPQKVLKVPQAAAVVPYRNCPAKTYKNSAGKRLIGMSVPEHCVTVGYVAIALCGKLDPLVQKFILPEYPILAAFHDLGKVCPGFLKKILLSVGLVNLYPSLLNSTYFDAHAVISEASVRAMDPYMAAISRALGGHHGRRYTTPFPADDVSYGGPVWEAERQSLAKYLESIFGGCHPRRNVSKLKLMMTLALICLSDWIASSEDYFDQKGGLSVEEIKEKAKRVVDSMGWETPEYIDDLSFEKIFGFSPYPQQMALFDNVTGPGIYIWEDATGNGKTEGAEYATYKCLSKGISCGLYYGLPTRLTSNKMHSRVEKDFIDKICKSNVKTRLIHGQVRTMMGGQMSPTGWFGPNRRAMLEPFGVGTIDQALLGILEGVSFSFVRKFGLASKVVILDEVHSYDSYTRRITVEMVKELRKMGCVIIILSATLTRAVKAQILGCRENRLTKQGRFPLLTFRKGKEIREVFPGMVASKQILVRHPNREQALRDAVDMANRGANVLWVDNAVDDGVSTYLELKAMGANVGLLHSRFVPFRRAEIEEYWTDLLGPDTKNRPRGRILVATQVIEQSLDIDFDILVSMLAPSDFVIQRLGRCWRHNKWVRPSFLPHPELWLLGTDLRDVRSEEEIGGRLGKTALVYNRFVLWRTARIWGRMTSVLLPADTRRILEATYRKPLEKEPKWVRPMYAKMKLSNLAKEQAAKTATSETMLDEDLVELEKETAYSTRKESVPTAKLIICRSAVFVNDELHLELYDGTKVVVPEQFPDDKWKEKRDAARAIEMNWVKVPESNGVSEMDAYHEYLEQVIFGRARIVVLRGNMLYRTNGDFSDYTYSDELGAIRL